MAISPQEARQLTDEELKHVEAEERTLDEWLRKTPVAQCRRAVLSHRLGDRVISELKRRYEAVGWDVTYQPQQNQMDDPAFVFQEAVDVALRGEYDSQDHIFHHSGGSQIRGNTVVDAISTKTTSLWRTPRDEIS